MFHDFVGQIQAVRVFNQSPARLATRSIPAHSDIILKVWDYAGGSVTGLDRYRLEEEIHGMDESLLRPWGAFSYEAGPVATRVIVGQTRLFVDGRPKPFCQLPDVSFGIVGIGVTISGHNLVPNCDCAPVVHIIREIIEVEEPVHGVAAHSELPEGHQRVACTCQL